MQKGMLGVNIFLGFVFAMPAMFVFIAYFIDLLIPFTIFGIGPIMVIAFLYNGSLGSKRWDSMIWIIIATALGLLAASGVHGLFS